MILTLIPNLILFIVASFLCFTLPGTILLKSLQNKLSHAEYIIISTVVGFVIFTLLSYLLLILNLSLLLILLIIAANLFAFKSFFKAIRNIPWSPRRQLIIFLSILFLGVFGQMLIIAPSGIQIGGDLIFWSAHGHDGSWHLSLVEEIKKGFPIQNPVLSNERLVNYHFFSDIPLAMFNMFFKFSPLDLYFRFFPLIFSILLGFLSYFLGKRIGGSFTSGIWAMVFTFFAGSFGYIVTFARDRQFSGESLFWASQIQSSTGNPPLIGSFIIVLASLILFKILLEEQKVNKLTSLALVLMLGALIEFKSYGSIVVLGSIGIVGLWQLIKEKQFRTFVLFLFSIFLSFLLYFPNSKGSTQFLIYEPWWFIRTLVVATDRLNWIDLELRRQTYIAESNWKRVVQLELTGFLIFLFGNLGMRFIGFLQFFKLVRTAFRNYFSLTLVLICLISFIFPLLYLQKGVAGNTIQFIQYFLLILGILAGVSTASIIELIRPKVVKVFFLLIIIIFAIPTQIGLIRDFYSRAPLAKITAEELRSLDFLKKQTDPNSVILTAPYNRYLSLQLATLPIWAWSDSSYISAFSNRRTFLSDREQADIMGYNLKSRADFQDNIFTTEDPKVFEEEIKKQQIDYLYFPIILKPKVDMTKTSLEKVFSNSEVEIWKI